MFTDNQDLSECAQEPIHIPSAIQPHGFFLTIDPINGCIVAASSNIDLFFTLCAQEILGKSLSTFSLPLEQWVQTAHESSNPLPQVFFLSHAHKTDPFILSLHRSHNYLTVEGEFAAAEDLSPDDLAQSVMEEVITLTTAFSIQELCHLGGLALQRLSGFGRVMAYQFEEDHHGCVIAETKIPSMESYLDHHFPASDIPAQARELYRTNLIRYIPDVSYLPVPLITSLSEAIDMSGSSLRSVSPIHLEYLRNMDVASSMSLSIIVDNKLWGLFACHHPSPTTLSHTARRYCEMFIRLFNALLEKRITNEISQKFFQLKNRHDTLKVAFQTLSDQSDPHFAFKTLGESWLNALESDGVCFLQENKLSLYGSTPQPEEIRILSGRINALRSGDVYLSSSVSADIPDITPSSSAGVISLILTHEPHSEILWFRDERIKELKWAGNPDKTLETDASMRITPRKSFEDFCELQKGKSLPWEKAHSQIIPFYKEFGSMIDLCIARETMQRQNQLLIQQGKMAMMGEMIGAIAHQWNQPLNSLSLLISSLSLVINESDMDRQELDTIKQIGMAEIRFMSETIDAFRHFFQPDRKEQSFSIYNSIRNVCDTLFPQLKLHNIELIMNEDLGELIGYPNEFKQIILNLFSNAYDVLIQNTVPSPWIKCTSKSDADTVILHICDNGRGIKTEILEQLFTPYVSSKSDSAAGKGIGLYLCKLIMEEHFKGTIHASNHKEGACFTLTFPKRNIEAKLS